MKKAKCKCGRLGIRLPGLEKDQANINSEADGLLENVAASTDDGDLIVDPNGSELLVSLPR